MARPSNTVERRAQISHGLMKVMARHGYDGASIADVAAAARLTPGLVHYHFKDKREILLTAVAELAAAHEARLDRAQAKAGGDSWKEVDGFIDAHLRLGAEADPQAVACWLLMGGEALREPKVRAAYDAVLASSRARLAAVLARGAARKAFRCPDPEAAAAAVLATIHGYFTLAATARDLIPKGSAAAAAKKMARGLLS